MTPREILHAIRDYPRAKAEADDLRQRLIQSENYAAKLSRENDDLLADISWMGMDIKSLREKTSALETALRLFCPALESTEQFYALYQAVAPSLDPDGYHLYHTAQSLTNFDLYGSFPYEDACGCFELADGYTLLSYLTACCFGSVDFSIVPGTCYEKAVSMKVNEDSHPYQDFLKKLYTQTLRELGILQEQPPAEAVQQQAAPVADAIQQGPTM